MSPRLQPETKTPPAWLAGVLAVLVLLPGLGAIDLWAPDEPRYAQVAEEMRSFEHGASGLLLLHLNGEAYSQKPPLYYWLAALVGAPTGHVDEWAARLPSALAGVACVLVVQSLGARLFSLPGVGTFAALILLTLLRFAHQARRAQLDVLLTLFELVALLAGWMLAKSGDPSNASRQRWLLLLHGAVGLALLTKGPVGALPYLVLTIHLAWEGRLREVRGLFPIWGVVLALAPMSCWLAASLALAPAGFFEEAVVDNVLTRFLSGTDHVRPFFYYAYQLPLDLLPWTPLVIAGCVDAWWRQRSSSGTDQGEGSALRLLLAWGITFLVFFSLSSGKRGLYMLPALPAFALIGGFMMARSLAAQRLPRGLELGGIVLIASLGLAGAAISVAHPTPSLPFSLARFGTLLVGVAALYIPIALGMRKRASSVQARALALVVALCAVQLALFLGLFPAIDDEKSPRPVAEAVCRLTADHERVGVFRYSTLTGGLEYYSGRRVVALESEDALARFVADGQRIVVARQHRADQVARVVRGTPRAALRHGSRRLVVLEAGMPDHRSAVATEPTHHTARLGKDAAATAGRKCP